MNAFLQTNRSLRRLLLAALGGPLCLSTLGQGSTNLSGRYPTVVYSAPLLAGTGGQYATGLALGPTGTVFVAGGTDSGGTFPFTSVLGDPNYGGSFVLQYDPATQTIVYATFIGGGIARGIAVDSAGSAYLTGWASTLSSQDGLPPLTNAFQLGYGGGNADAWVAKLAPDGSHLLYSTLLGGGDTDAGQRIAVDGSGQAVVIGTTASGNFRTTPGVLQPNLRGTNAVGVWNAFVVKLSAAGTNLVYSTYLGAEQTVGLALALDNSANVYVSGATVSTNFPGPKQFQFGTLAGGTNAAFVAKLAADARTMSWLALLGGDGDQSASALTLDSHGNAYVFGHTSATNFPITSNAVQTAYSDAVWSGSWDGFVAKLTSDGSSLPYSTYLGGSSSDDSLSSGQTLPWAERVGGISVDGAGNVYVANHRRYTESPSPCPSADPLVSDQSYVAKIDPTGASLLYLRLLGDSLSGAASAVGADGVGNVYVTSLVALGGAGPSRPPYFVTSPGIPGQYGGDSSFLTHLSESALLSPNDAFTNRNRLTGARLTIQANNSAATKEAGEPLHAGNAGGKSLWWTWTAPTNGVLKLSTEDTSFDTLLAVYTGTALANLTAIGSNAASPGLLSVRVAAGQTCQIAVDGKDGASGALSLSLEFSEPPNDDFANRIPLIGFAKASGYNTNATVEPCEPDFSRESRRTVWWSWTPTSKEPTVISTLGSSFATILAVWSGTALETLQAANPQEAWGYDTVHIPAPQVGVEYQIQVGAQYGDVGSIVLHIEPGAEPANDHFAGRTNLMAAHLSVTNYNWFATADTNTPNLGPKASGKTLWWTWTAPADGWVAVDTRGSDFNSVLGVFTGSALTNLTRVALDDSTRSADWYYYSYGHVEIGVTNQAAYNFVVDGDSGGTVVLTVDFYQQPKIFNVPVAWSPGTPFQFKVIGKPGQRYRIQGSGDLTNWSEFSPGALFGPIFEFGDTNIPGPPRRFYRVIQAN